MKAAMALRLLNAYGSEEKAGEARATTATSVSVAIATTTLTLSALIRFVILNLSLTGRHPSMHDL
ncbi:hypothetical protein IQ260_04715 [Leptolyngbya cf. ectocarpi LEGE 11479]|uniref:Uncharacterized protein n=1 Tax=Leptolyngbya cf. ectocarpi LEGE 11479 TaxID=1828722 RepID=A0A928WYW7_LEPEC|nr:hypothetical protein [Leptolyngbya ectocarpi]MBE9065949.1 hypothetical protein [Leptolyngbya cf. ectocarpi LEGE 11479]